MEKKKKVGATKYEFRNDLVRNKDPFFMMGTSLSGGEELGEG